MTVYVVRQTRLSDIKCILYLVSITHLTFQFLGTHIRDFDFADFRPPHLPLLEKDFRVFSFIVPPSLICMVYTHLPPPLDSETGQLHAFP